MTVLSPKETINKKYTEKNFAVKITIFYRTVEQTQSLNI